MKKKLFIKTYGCQMNVYDSEKMADLLSAFGYETTNNVGDADMVIFNTCHIREKAEQKVFSDLGRVQQHKKDREAEGKEMLIAVGGCVGQAQGDIILKQAPYVDLVFGTQTYHRLPELIAKTLRSSGQKGRIIDTDFPEESKFDVLPLSTSTRASSFLAIQEGCDKFCTYCCVPYTRGIEVSRSVDDVLKEAQHLIELGAKEITLLGQNVNAYHGYSKADSKEWTLGRLLEKLAGLDKLERIRYITSHPMDVDDSLIEAHRDIQKLMPYLHLPLQSGSDRILSAMNRKHTAATYFEIIEKFKKARPDMAFSSDFIVGFPSETEDDHKKTLAAAEVVKYAQAYSFKYSIRPGTPAGVYENQVPEEIKARRLQELQDLLFKHQEMFNKQNIGTTMDVLLERKGKREGQLIGKSPYMQSVVVDGNESMIDQIVKVRITDAHVNSLTGVIEK